MDYTLEIGDIVYQVDMAFDNVLLFLEILNDKSLTDIEKIHFGINILLGVSFLLPLEYQYQIFNTLVKEFIGSEAEELDLDMDGNPLPMSKKAKNYDLKYDAEYIYASFMQAYGIDLIEQQGKLHWYKFKALLNGLPEGTKFMSVLDIRTREERKGMSPEEKRDLKKLKKQYALPCEGGGS